MSLVSSSIPLKLLHESKGHVISLEMKSGELLRGHLMHFEDSMNCLLENVKITSKDGQLTTADQMFIKGSQIRWVVVPDALKHAPCLKQQQQTSVPRQTSENKKKKTGDFVVRSKQPNMKVV